MNLVITASVLRTLAVTAHLCSGSSHTTRVLSERGQLRRKCTCASENDSELSGVVCGRKVMMPRTIMEVLQQVLGNWQLEARADRARSCGRHRRLCQAKRRVMPDQKKLPVASHTTHVVAGLECRPHTETRKRLKLPDPDMKPLASNLA